MAKTPGSIWIEVNELHYVDASGNERYMQGDYWGPMAGTEPKQTPGYVWVSNVDGYLYYIAGNGLKYRVPVVLVHGDAAATNPSLWVEGMWLAHSVQTGKYLAHGDHADGGSSSHTDSAHGDGHTDGAHGDSHGDGHTDTAHSDGSHSDAGHGDNHGDYSLLKYHDDCTQTDHGNVTSHGDHEDGVVKPYPGWHCDFHDDATHGDASHADAGHGDSHNDQAHQDGTHGDTHLDSGHADHTDGGGGGHYDYPAYIGP